MNTEYDVVIVGAGPTGLSLGAELKRLGISSLILDKLAEGGNTSRAAGIHARTLEVLEPLGVTAELLKEGIKIPTFQIWDRNKMLTSISFKDLDTKYPFLLACPQERTEAILQRKLESLGGAVQRQCEVVAVRPKDNKVEVQYKCQEELKTVYAKWIVGCDGMHSIVREQAAIEFAGGEYEETFMLADVEMDWPLDRDAKIFLSEKGLVAVIGLPGDRFRIIATEKDAPKTPAIEDFQRIMDERGPKNSSVKIHSIAWGARFRIHHRVAKVMRKGRIILAGDAAHVHSPAGGQGMNTGIQDAITLAAALKEALQNGNETALTAWEQKRLEIARSVVKLTDRITRLATASSPGMKLLRNVVISFIAKFHFVQHALARKLSELDNR